MKPTYVSLFSGAGGLDVGLEQAGFQAHTLCEIEPVFCQTLAANQGWRHKDGYEYFKGSSIVNADIRDLKASDFCKVKNLDLVVGGPPCQAFSSSGKQLSVLDPRGVLVNEYCRLISELKPKMFIFENVRGLVTARNKKGVPGGVITEVIEILHDIGYSCRATLLNSADYGAYQRRVRCFIVGSRKGVAPEFPATTHSKSPTLFEQKWLTLADFLDHHSDSDKGNFVLPSSNLAPILAKLPNGSGIKSPGKSEKTRPSGHWGYRQGTFIADLGLPARTVTGSSSQDWVRWGGILRRLTLSEVKLLQGFPSDWLISGNKAQQFKQVGNAVPSVFGKVLGERITQHLQNFPKEKPVRIPLPDNFKGYIEYTKRDHERNKSSRGIHHFFK